MRAFLATPELCLQASSTVSRRRLLAGAGAALGAALPAAAAVASVPLAARGATTNPDAELLALGREFEAAWENENRLVTIATADAEYDAAWASTSALVDRIGSMTATTLEGLRVKTRAILWCGYEECEAGPEMFGFTTTDHRLAGAIIRDLLNMGGKA